MSAADTSLVEWQNAYVESEYLLDAGPVAAEILDL
jgi:hypothetical protein